MEITTAKEVKSTAKRMEGNTLVANETLTADDIRDSLKAGYIDTTEAYEKLAAMSDEEVLKEFLHWHEEKNCSYFKSCWIMGNRLEGYEADETDYYEE